MKSILLSLLIIAGVTSSRASTLPGFGVEKLGSTVGFASSVAVDRSGRIFYTNTRGEIFRLSERASIPIARVTTVGSGDSGLLGMAMLDATSAVVHYTTPGQTADIVSKIDLFTGSETVLATLVADHSSPGRGTSTEHHGGNPSVAPDGSVFVGIGDYGGGLIASLPEWNGGKIFRIFPDGRIAQFARGMRNPFDTAWDPVLSLLVAPDNGPSIDDEINLIVEGSFCGWPFTMGNGPVIEGATPPLYVFPAVVAPTGLARLTGANSTLRAGYLLGTFVTKSILYIEDIGRRPLPDPIALIERETGFVIDVAEAPDGAIVFVTGDAVYRLVVPSRGDCNGDGLVDLLDVAALTEELRDGNPERATEAQNGAYRGSFGCDVNGDGLIDSRDVASLRALLGLRTRPSRLPRR